MNKLKTQLSNENDIYSHLAESTLKDLYICQLDKRRLEIYSEKKRVGKLEN